MRRRLPVIVLLVLLLCAACNAKPVTPTVSSLSPLTSPLLTATSQLTAMPTLKVAPSPTPWPTSTATALPTLAPTPVGITPPSGLIYKTHDGLWRVNLDGESVRLLAVDAGHMSFELSPEGDRVLYWDWNEGDIWLGDLHTSDMRNLTNSSTRFECCPLWWPDRPETILFASQSSNDRPWGPIWLVAKNLSNGDLHIIDQSGSFVGPADFSADGTSLAYSKNGQPVVCRPEKGCAPCNLADFGVSITTTLGAGSPAWSPNGQSIAWTMSSFYSNTQEFGTGVFNLRERSWRLFHPYKPIGRGGRGFPSLIWSPDSKWLVMQVDTRNPSTGREEVSQQVIRIDDGSGEEHAVAPGPLVWSPDSRHLISNRTMIEVDTWQSQPLALPQDAQVVAWINPAPQ
jgi:hypothetical protein